MTLLAALERVIATFSDPIPAGTDIVRECERREKLRFDLLADHGPELLAALKDQQRMEFIAEQCKTCTAYMSGDFAFSAGHGLHNLRGKTFREAIDRAIAAARGGEVGDG